MDYLLWFDGSKAPLAERLTRAAQHFEKKHGRSPTTALLPMNEEIAGLPGGISCERKPYVIENHLWLG